MLFFAATALFGLPVLCRTDGDSRVSALPVIASNSENAAACGQVPVIMPSPTINGALQADDCVAPDGSYFDVYRFQVIQENDFFTFTLSSTQFEPRMLIYSGSYPGGVLVRQSPNAAGGVATIGGHNIVGDYVLVVKSAAAGELGNYSLRFDYLTIEPIYNPQFNYDGMWASSDLSVYRPSNHTWYLRQESGGITSMQFGEDGDKIVPADYDGDDKTDIAVFRPSTGTWFIVQSQTQTLRTVNWGQDGDLPISYTNGLHLGIKSPIMVFRPSNGTWYRRDADDTFSMIQWGMDGDRPVVGKFDSYFYNIAVFRPSEGKWYFYGSFLGRRTLNWGQAGDIPVTADYDGDGLTDVGVYHPSTGQWFLIKTRFGDIQVTSWGEPGDIPVPDDYGSLDGRAQIAVYRPSNSRWYFSSFGPFSAYTGTGSRQFGEAGDIPTPAAFRY